MTTSLNVKRLRWLMFFLMLANAVLAAVGQPAAYWHDPSRADERNALFRWFMHLGPAPYLAFTAVLLLGAFALVTYLPRCVGSVVLLTFLLMGFVGICSWTVNRYNLHIWVAVVMGIAVAWSFVRLARPPEGAPPAR